MNGRNQSAADHQGSTAAGQRERTFTAGMGRSIIGQKRTLSLSPTMSLERLLLIATVIPEGN